MTTIVDRYTTGEIVCAPRIRDGRTVYVAGRVIGAAGRPPGTIKVRVQFADGSVGEHRIEVVFRPTPAFRAWIATLAEGDNDATRRREAAWQTLAAEHPYLSRER